MTDQPVNDKSMTYEGSGVNYAAMDPAKVNAQEVGRTTAGNLDRFGYREVEWTRGESVYLIESPDHFLAFVVEGLGTKNLVADAMWHVTGQSYYAQVAQCTAAMVLNDMATLGASPMVFGQYLAVGSSQWFANTERSGSLAIGTAQACDEAGAVYACGETPTLRDIILPSASDIAGASMGIIKPKDRLIDPRTIQDGDAIVLLASSGVHANGLTLIRDLGELVSYREPLDDGRMFGEAVLDPTYIYVPVIEAVLDAGIRPHYGVNVTGHGWRKLMRAVEPFTYVIERIPTPQPVFGFIQRHGNITDTEMYGNYNMGAGFALYVKPEDANRVVELSRSLGIDAWVSGYIEKTGDEKKVVIEPMNLVYGGSTLAVR